jgi:hypothetical protein
MADASKERPTYTTDFFTNDTDRAVFLGNPVIDNLMTAVIALGAEVWSNRRRQAVLEALLEEKGVTEEMIEAYMPSEDRAKKWGEERDAFVKRTFSVLAREADLPLSADWQKDIKS